MKLPLEPLHDLTYCLPILNRQARSTAPAGEPDAPTAVLAVNLYWQTHLV